MMGSNHPSRGFTLLEIMVVLVIISIILTFATLSGDTGARQLENEARRLAALLNIASEETIMNSREYRVVFGANGYSFYQFAGAGRWDLIEDDLLRPREFPEGYSLILTLEGEKIEPGKSDADDLAAEAAVYFLSSGEVTSFEVELVNGHGGKCLVTNRNGLSVVLVSSS